MAQLIYLSWERGDLARLESLGLCRVITECADDGTVVREVGFDESGTPVHRAPDPGTTLHLFDNQVIAGVSSAISCMSLQEFAAAWSAVPSNNSFKPKPLRGSA